MDQGLKETDDLKKQEDQIGDDAKDIAFWYGIGNTPDEVIDGDDYR